MSSQRKTTRNIRGTGYDDFSSVLYGRLLLIDLDLTGSGSNPLVSRGGKCSTHTHQVEGQYLTNHCLGRGNGAWRFTNSISQRFLGGQPNLWPVPYESRKQDIYHWLPCQVSVENTWRPTHGRKSERSLPTSGDRE